MSHERGADHDGQERLITEAVERWLADHDPLARTEFDRINSALIRTVGNPVDHPTNGHNQRVREADAEAFGQFAFEYETALVELAEDAQYGDLHSYPVAGSGGRWVPLLVTTDDTNGVVAAERRIHESYHVIEDIAPTRLNHGEVVATDGGQPTPGPGPDPDAGRCKTVGCENPPVENGYCKTCISISPGIRDDPNDGEHDDEPEETKGERRHQISAETNESDKPGKKSEAAMQAREAFADAVAWFHSQLARDISDLGLTYVDDNGDEQPVETPREWFREVRGWSEATLDDKQVGWASPNHTGLLDHLMGEDYGKQAILGTGLFTEDLRPLWQGRFVFPYFDADGQPVYAISRATGDEGGGAVGYDGHPRDGLSGKYAKPAHTKPYAHVTEPIYGVESVEDGQPVLITEGIADAITAHQAGYPCISPVTTRFKRDDREALREVLEDRDVPRAYVVQDAERPTSDVDEEGRLTLTQTGEGLSGALDTAAYLNDNNNDNNNDNDNDNVGESNGIDARVVELPGPELGLDKVDLDDYLREWATDADLSAVLAGAKPAREHPAYDPRAAAIDAAERDRLDALSDRNEGEGGQSALFGLTLRDVSGLDADYRGPSPLGHHGESESYFVVIDERGLAYDHKYKTAYNTLTYLLCEAGVRSPDDPNGRLSDREVFGAWRYAKREGTIPDDDPIPRRALSHVAVEHGHCERSDIEDEWKLPSDAYDAALDTLADEYDVDPGRDPLGGAWGRTPDAVDPTTLDVVLDPETAWRATGMVGPDDLDTPLDLDATADGEHWQCSQCDGALGVVRAVALQHGTIECCEHRLGDDEYDDAYRRARTQHGAPLPEYVSQTTATDNWAYIQGALAQLTHWHLSTLDSTVTGLGGTNDDVLAEIDPTWEDSASGKRILAFWSGAFYCREHECTIDPLRIVALEKGIIHECDDALTGEAFIQAYHIAREQYGAPLPEWSVGNPEHIPVLPPAEDLLGEFTTDRDALATAREHVEREYRELASDARSAWLFRPLPALGKTTSVVKNADEYPALYLTARNELQQEVADKARHYGRSFMQLPIFAEDQPNEVAVQEAVELVREEGDDGKDLLRTPEELIERIEAPITEDDEEDKDGADTDDGTVELERASCPVANGEHGEEWQFVVHVARALDHSPKEIHTHDTALFGATLPCHDGSGCECEYKLGWDRANDPENPNDILIGHYGHGYVEGARTYAERTDERTRLTERVIAIDEFPGDVYDEWFGEEFVDHATWAARALHPGIEDRQDLFETASDLWNDDLTRAWMGGTATTKIDALAATDQRLAAMERLSRALTTVEELHETLDGTDMALAAAFGQVQALGPEWEREAIAAAHDALRYAIEDADRQVRQRVQSDVLPAFVAAENALTDTDTDTDPDSDSDGETQSDTAEYPSLGATAVPDRLGGDLSELVEGAIEAFREARESAAGLLRAAQTALAGGEEGCRELAAHARDGYAHPLAHLLLYGILADGESATTIPTESFDFEPDSESENDGTNLKSVRREREMILLDRNHHGATVRHPPAFREGDYPNPVVGLDATGRERLWELAIGCPVEARDIHESARERRAFLRNTLNLQVVQTTPHTNTYSGSPTSKNFDGDVALVEQVRREYGKQRLRRDTVTATSKPGVITTKKAQGKIEDRIKRATAAVRHYGDITGSNALGELNLGVVLGCQHFGDAPVEKWAAFAGETVERSGHGNDLDYQSTTANTFRDHMRDDQTLQAILRFGRDKEGAVVFAHTSALAESLPVVGEGGVVKAFSTATKEVTHAATQYRGREFAVGEVAEDEDVTCSKRTVRRVLNELAGLGYLDKRETKNGLATGYRTAKGEEPGVGEVELPDLDDPFAPGEGPANESNGRGGPPDDPDGIPSSVSSTGFVWVIGVDSASERSRRSARATLPAPNGIATMESAVPPG